MPLFKWALALIRANLEELQNGNRVRLVAIGTLTDVQLGAINLERKTHAYPPLVAEVVFIGRHIYESRVVRDGYTIGDGNRPNCERYGIRRCGPQNAHDDGHGKSGPKSRSLRKFSAR
jgi:hypothetical protein